MDGTEALPTQGELAVWKARAIEVADQFEHPDVADALRRGGGAEQAIRTLGESSLLDIENVWAALLTPISSGTDLGHILALLTRLGQPDATLTTPRVVQGPDTMAMVSRTEEIRYQIRAAADAAGTRKRVRLIEYLSSACACVRLSAIGVGSSAFNGSGHLTQILIDSLVLRATFEIVKGSLSRPLELDDAFALALGGLAAVERSDSGWTVRRVFG